MGKLIAYTGIEYAGRSTTILNIAYALEKEGKKVLYIDADQTRGKLSFLYDLPLNKIGLLEAATSLDPIIFKNSFIYDKKTGITFLTLTPSANCGDLFLLSPEQAEQFYRKVKPLYDYILVDCGNLFYESLTSVALIMADCIFLLLPPEKRGKVWYKSVEKVLKMVKEKIKYITVYVSESPEITSYELFNNKAADLDIPYIFNMKEYTRAGKIFYQNPTGKKAQDYLKNIIKFIYLLKE